MATKGKRLTATKHGTRIQRHSLTIAATTANERPHVWIETLKGGEITWGVRMPAANLTGAVDKAIAEAERIRQIVAGWREEDRLEAERRQLAAKRATAAAETEA